MMITLATLPNATAQEVFDQVVAHLRKQNKKSTDGLDRANCLYRGANGLKCAAGCLIGDDEYRPIMDGSDLTSTTWSTLVAAKIVPPDHKKLIKDLQRVHDQFEPDKWERELEIVADDHKLVIPAIV